MTLLLKSNGIIDTFNTPVSPLLLLLEVWDVKTTSRKSCALNLFVVSDLTFDPPRLNLSLLLLICFLYFHMYSEAQNRKSADKEPIHGH